MSKVALTIMLIRRLGVNHTGSDKMTRFEELPLDLLPQILVHLFKPGHVASLCLVNRAFYLFSVPNLYRRIVILPWHKSSKYRVCGLFEK